jgi:hypothetical protein
MTHLDQPVVSAVNQQIADYSLPKPWVLAVQPREMDSDSSYQDQTMHTGTTAVLLRGHRSFSSRRGI